MPMPPGISSGGPSMSKTASHERRTQRYSERPPSSLTSHSSSRCSVEQVPQTAWNAASEVSIPIDERNASSILILVPPGSNLADHRWLFDLPRDVRVVFTPGTRIEHLSCGVKG